MSKGRSKVVIERGQVVRVSGETYVWRVSDVSTLSGTARLTVQHGSRGEPLVAQLTSHRWRDFDPFETVVSAPKFGMRDAERAVAEALARGWDARRRAEPGRQFRLEGVEFGEYAC